MSSESGTAEWASVGADVWLKPKLDVKTISSLIRHLALQNINVIELSKALQSENGRTYYGLLCIAQEPLDLEVAYDVVGGSKAAPLIPKKIANADVVIDLLNIELAIADPKEQCLGVLEDFVQGASGKENPDRLREVFDDLHMMIPVAFAHNITARTYPAEKEDTTRLYSFVVSSHDQIFMIGRSGTLLKLQQSGVGLKRFGEILHAQAKCEVFAIVRDELRDIDEQLQKERDTLEKLTGHGADKLNGSLNDTLSYEELAEISALSEELESAEDFPLLVETDFGRTEEVPRSKPSDECAQVEKRIRDLLKRLAAARNEFPHLWWESGSVDSVYADPEYPKFAVFYSRLVKLKTPMIIRSPAVNLRAATAEKNSTKEKRKSQPSQSKDSSSVKRRGSPIKLSNAAPVGLLKETPKRSRNSAAGH